MHASDCTFADPPTRQTLAQARQVLQERQASASQLAARILSAEEELERIVTESRCTIKGLEKEKATIEDGIATTLAYLSPIRRLPQELLAQIFNFIFEEYPVCAWVLGKVCSIWRRQVLAMPRLWSKVCSTLSFVLSSYVLRTPPSIPANSAQHRFV